MEVISEAHCNNNSIKKRVGIDNFDIACSQKEVRLQSRACNFVDIQSLLECYDGNFGMEAC
ncbi:hypothetical protein SESBI_18561 [Sesbania bispinosa]|nr:hypothetical protein SESBI_18561 [Sesbania bispinosa]